jgi:hypothetical protein
MLDRGARLSLVLSLAALASAVEWKGPKPTPVNQLPIGDLGFSPKTTEAPKIKGRMPGHELFARATDPAVLCGYVSGSQGKSFIVSLPEVPNPSTDSSVKSR